MIYYKKSNVKDFYGKRKKQRNRYAERSPCRKNNYVCAALTVPLTVFRYGASGLFTSSEGEIEMSCIRIMLILIFKPICTFYEIPASAMRGLGYSAISAAETVIGTCLIQNSMDIHGF